MLYTYEVIYVFNTEEIQALIFHMFNMHLEYMKGKKDNNAM